MWASTYSHVYYIIIAGDNKAAFVIQRLSGYTARLAAWLACGREDWRSLGNWKHQQWLGSRRNWRAKPLLNRSAAWVLSVGAVAGVSGWADYITSLQQASVEVAAGFVFDFWPHHARKFEQKLHANRRCNRDGKIWCNWHTAINRQLLQNSLNMHGCYWQL